MTEQKTHSGLRDLAERKLKPGTVTYGAEGILAQGVRDLVEQLEAAQDALCAVWWTGVTGLAEELIAASVTPEMRVDYARRHAGLNPASEVSE